MCTVLHSSIPHRVVNHGHRAVRQISRTYLSHTVSPLHTNLQVMNFQRCERAFTVQSRNLACTPGIYCPVCASSEVVVLLCTSLFGTVRRRQRHLTPVLLPGKSHGRRSLEGYSPWGRWGLDMIERLHFHFLLSCIGEGNGNPLQCSCLENPRDGGAWWAAVYGVAQSRTRLKWLSGSSSSSSRVGKNSGISFVYSKILLYFLLKILQKHICKK